MAILRNPPKLTSPHLSSPQPHRLVKGGIPPKRRDPVFHQGAWIPLNESFPDDSAVFEKRSGATRTCCWISPTLATSWGKAVCASNKQARLRNIPEGGWVHDWTYCWWKKSYTSWYGKYPFTHRVLYIPGGAGFLPSTVRMKSTLIIWLGG